MTQVSMSHLRQHLPAVLKRVQAGDAIQITSRGRGTLVDVLSPLGPDLADSDWGGDADHL